MNEIHIGRNGDQFGPYDEETARAFYADGRIAPTDLVWHDGLNDWQSAKDVFDSTVQSPVPTLPIPLRQTPVENGGPAKIVDAEKNTTASTQKDLLATAKTLPDKKSTWKSIFYGIFSLLLIGALIQKSCSLINTIGSTPGPSVPSKFKNLRDSAESAVKDYMLASTGKGICDTVTNSRLGDLRVGTAAFKYGKPEPSIIGSYSADCTYYIIGEKKVKRETYWFHITKQESSGVMNGTILLDNPDMVARSAAQSNFRDAN